MPKLKCDVCGKRECTMACDVCNIEETDFLKGNCPFDVGFIARWEIDHTGKKETPDKYPVLSAEELHKRGIKWPKGYDGAAIDKTGNGFHYIGELELKSNAGSFYWVGQRSYIPGIVWDNRNWKESRIQRPPRCAPAWCHVGDLVWHPSSGYGIVTCGFDDTTGTVRVHFFPHLVGSVYTYTLWDPNPVTLQESKITPWTKRDLSDAVGMLFLSPTGEKGVATHITPEDENAIFVAGHGPVTIKELMEIKLDRNSAKHWQVLLPMESGLCPSPCGHLRHRESASKPWVY